MKPNSLEDWLLLLENRHTQEIQLGLSRVHQVAKSLNLLESEATVITVAGTNGKGSTVQLLESVYREAKYSVASYTSPHLVVFNERIKINGHPISDEELIIAFEAVEKARGDTHLTYFEMTTLAALWHFKQQTLDLIILEVGLGGRLDATNIINNDLAIITTIAMDHEEFLGASIEAIGYEKAGVLRTGKPFIYADKNPPYSIISYAQEIDAKGYFREKDYHSEPTEKGFSFCFLKNTIKLPASNLHPNSIAAVIMATLCLQKKWPINDLQRVNGIKSAVLPGRLQLVHKPHRTLFDVAHNPQAVSYLATYLNEFYPRVKVHAVFSAFADKDLKAMISSLKPIVDCWYPALLPAKRAASRNQLLTALNANEIRENLCYNDPFLAYQAACNNALASDLIVVFGSFVMVGLILPTLI